MTQVQQILNYLWSIAPAGATNSQLAKALDIRSHQGVYMTTQDLMMRRRIRGEQEGKTWRFYALDAPEIELASPVPVSANRRVEIGLLTPLEFEALARQVLCQHYQVKNLAPGQVGDVPKKFDFVSPDEQVVGDAKYFTRVGGVIRILDIAQKDLLQLARDRKTFMFLLIMPVIFTFLFGYAFGGFGGAADSRLPVGYLDEDRHELSGKLHDLLAVSKIIRLDENQARARFDLEQLVAEQKLAAAIIVPARYSKDRLAGKHPRLTLLVGDASSSTATTIEADILAAANRLDSAVSMALSMEQVTAARLPFNYAFKQSLAAWGEPPIAITETTSAARSNTKSESLAHTSPGMMLQFAIAGLLTAAQVIVSERKSRALQRLLTTATRRVDILLGHYLAIFALVFSQFMLLILFGALALRVDYLRDAGATLLVAFSAAMCIAALGLLIGVVAKSEEQAVIFSLIPMFVFSGLGGAWVPLEVTGATFQAIGHLSPIAWAMDGFKNVSIRGWGIESALLPAAALLGYAVVFFTLATWRLWVSEEH